MPKLYIHIINSLILIGLGLIGYFTQPNQAFTMLSAVIGGFVLLLFTRMLKKYNQFAEHTIAVILLLLLLVFAWRINIGDFEASSYMVFLCIMAVSCFIALATFIFGFIKEWRQGKTGL